MAYNILLNSSNVVAGSSNCQYKYNFPMGNFDIDDNTVLSINQITIPYSWFNITAAYGNNTFQYVMPSGTGAVTRTITIPDGFYQLADINSVLWADMFSQGFYFYQNNPNQLSNASQGLSNLNIVYPISFSQNIKLYSNQVTLMWIPSSAAQVISIYGYNWLYANSANFPTNYPTLPQIIISGKFANYIGFGAGIYPPPSGNGVYPSSSVNSPPSLTYNLSTLTAANSQPIVINSTSLLSSSVNNTVCINSYTYPFIINYLTMPPSGVGYNWYQYGNLYSFPGLAVGMYMISTNVLYTQNQIGRITAIDYAGSNITLNNQSKTHLVSVANANSFVFNSFSSLFPTLVTSSTISATSNASSITINAANASILAGMAVFDNNNGNGFVYVVSVSSTTITLSNSLSVTTGDTVNFYNTSFVPIQIPGTITNLNSFTITSTMNIGYITVGMILTAANHNWVNGGASLVIPSNTTVLSINFSTNVIGLSNNVSIPFNTLVYFSLPGYVTSNTSFSNPCPAIPFAPNATQVNAVTVRCNLVENPIGIPSDLMDSFPINNTFGSNINYLPISDNASKIRKGKHSSLIVTLQDQNFNNMNIQDTNVSISLVIKKQ